MISFDVRLCWIAISQIVIFVFLSVILFPAAQVVTAPVDKETESLHHGEEELFSRSDIKKFSGALPVGSLVCQEMFNYQLHSLPSNPPKKERRRERETESRPDL